MKKIKLLALAFAIALSGTTAFAQQNSFSIGKIDFRRVILLHPKMADFQPSTGAFKISRDAKAKESYNTEVKDNEKQVAALEKEMQELKKKISAEDKAFDEKIDILTRKYLKRMDPKDMILDEPTAGLDPAGRKEILGLISKLQKEQNITIILVSHSMEDVAEYVERIIVINKGKIALDGTPKEVFGHSEELKSFGLALPQVTDAMIRLKNQGINVSTDVITINEAVQELSRVLR